MIERAYMREPWYQLLRSRCHGVVQASIAKQLGISPTSLSMVVNGTGPYGEGVAKTDAIADRVLHTFGRYVCPHLTDEAAGVEQVITAEQCRAIAHRSPPTASPRDMEHWQACRKCPHREASAPPISREPIPRKPKTTASDEETAHV